MKAVLHYRASEGFRRRLADLCPDWLEIAIIPESDRSGFLAALDDVEALLHVLEPVTADHIQRAPRLRLIQKIGVGVNTIDVKTAAARGVAVANMPGTNSQAVAEMALLLMLAALRRGTYFDRVIRGGGWNVTPETFDDLGEIHGKTVGLVGYGVVAGLLAPVLAALGANVIYTSRSEKPDALGTRRALDDLLREADIVSLHLPLTAETERLLDARRLGLMKRGAVIVNTARGGLIDEAALIEALRAGRLRAAGLDVFQREPVDKDNSLLSLDNVAVTPHIAWLTPETLDRSLTIAIENCARIREGRELLHRVA
jgi:phosphoglycerate dehydrogenase-like enzyme